MITRITIPQLSANITEATIITWTCSEGDRVDGGRLLAEVSTEKANIDIEAPTGGIVRRILATEKSTLPVGYVIALLGGPDEALPDVDADNAALLTQHQETQALANVGRSGTRRRGDRKAVRATPAARRLARELGVSLREMKSRVDVDVITESVVQQYHEKEQDA